MATKKKSAKPAAKAAAKPKAAKAAKPVHDRVDMNDPAAGFPNG